MRKATPAICSTAPSTVLRRVVRVKSPNVSPSKMSSGKCSSVLSRDNCASTGWLVLSDDFTAGGTGDGRATSSITFHSPGLPSPDTVLRKPGGGSLSLAPLKSKYRSAAPSDPAATTAMTQMLKRNMALQRNKKRPGDKRLCPAATSETRASLLVDHVRHGMARRDERQHVFRVRCDDVEEVRLVGVQHPLHRRAQVFLEHDPFRRHVEAFCHGDEVGVDLLAMFRVAEISVSSVALVEFVFPLHHHAQVLVVQDERLGGDLFNVRRRQFLHVHQERAVTVNVNNLLVRSGNLRAERRRITIAHRPQSGAGEELARMLVLVILPGPHLMLADPGSDDRLALGQLVKHLDDHLRQDDLARFAA